MNTIWRYGSDIHGALTDVDGVDVDGTGYGAYSSGGKVRKKVTVISGLDHLEGETIQVLADGAQRDDVTVSSGVATLAEPAAIVHLGYAYTKRVTTLPLEVPAAQGASMGRVKRIEAATIMFHETMAATYGTPNGFSADIPFRQSDTPMDAPAPLFTGRKVVPFDDDYTLDPQVWVEQPAPLPMTILAIIAHTETPE